MDILERLHTVEHVGTNGTAPMGSIPVDWQGLSAIIAQLMTQAEQIGRLRAERDALAVERNRLMRWIETDREFTDRLLVALESELATLREEVRTVRAVEAPPATVDESPPAAPVEQRPRTYGIGRRRREGMESRAD